MIKINKSLSNEYVCCLPKELELSIMQKVKKEVSALALTEEEVAEAIENANNSKVTDLTDTITIEFI